MSRQIMFIGCLLLLLLFQLESLQAFMSDTTKLVAFRKSTMLFQSSQRDELPNASHDNNNNNNDDDDDNDAFYTLYKAQEAEYGLDLAKEFAQEQQYRQKQQQQQRQNLERLIQTKTATEPSSKSSSSSSFGFFKSVKWSLPSILLPKQATHKQRRRSVLSSSSSATAAMHKEQQQQQQQNNHQSNHHQNTNNNGDNLLLIMASSMAMQLQPTTTTTMTTTTTTTSPTLSSSPSSPIIIMGIFVMTIICLISMYLSNLETSLLGYPPSVTDTSSWLLAISSLSSSTF